MSQEITRADVFAYYSFNKHRNQYQITNRLKSIDSIKVWSLKSIDKQILLLCRSKIFWKYFQEWVTTDALTFYLFPPKEFFSSVSNFYEAFSKLFFVRCLSTINHLVQIKRVQRTILRFLWSLEDETCSIPVLFLVYLLKQNYAGEPFFILQVFLGTKEQNIFQDDFTARLMIDFDGFINNNKKRCCKQKNKQI